MKFKTDNGTLISILLVLIAVMMLSWVTLGNNQSQNKSFLYKIQAQNTELLKRQNWSKVSTIKTQVSLLRLDIRDLETRLSNEISGAIDYQAEWIIYQLRHNQGKLAQIYYLMEEISGVNLDIMVLNSKLVDKRLNWHLPTCPKKGE